MLDKRPFVLLATLCLTALAPGGPAHAQNADVLQRLERFGGMAPADARELVRQIDRVLAENAARGGDRYDRMRRAMNHVVFGADAGPGRTRPEYDRRLAAVLQRLRSGLDPEILEAFFPARENSAVMCANDFGVTVGHCDALIAAASRQEAALPYAPPDDGAGLRDALREGGVGRREAQEVANKLREVMLGVPRNLTQDDRGRGLLVLLDRCPGGLSARESQIRAWHVGPTVGMARCIAAQLSGLGHEAAVQQATVRFGLSPRGAEAFVTWGAPAAAQQPAQAQPAPVRPPTQDAESWRERARAHFRARRFAEAATAYRNATQLDPSHAGSFAGLGASLLASRDPRGAVRAYQQAVRLAPTHSGFYSALARAQAQSGDREAALASLRRALHLDPNNRVARQGMEALERLAQAAASQPPAQPPQPPQPAEPSLPEVPARDAIINTLRPLAGALSDCAPGFSGQAVFTLTVRGETGEVEEASATSGGPEGEAERACMVGVMRSATFPRFSRAELSINYPYEL